MSTLRLAYRLLRETDKRLLWKLAWNMGWKAMLSVQKHKARLKRGEVFPPFLYVSIINSCNLRCQGCWVDVAAKMEAMAPDAFHTLVREAQDMGNAFFGIVGGEPFMHPQFFELLEPHPDCYFQVFTNGQFITDQKAKRLRALGNVTPLISVEGNEIVSDQRRGRSGVYSKTMEGLHNCLNNKVLTGVCTSLCQTNIDDLLTEQWVDRLIEMGVMYTWFHVYRPMGPDANPQLSLTPEQQRRARQFVVEMRARKPIIIIDAYYDGEGRALCPAATGISHHINPWGDIEPCPIVQFTRESIHRFAHVAVPRDGDKEMCKDSRHLRDKFIDSEFLHDFRQLSQSTTRGCIVLERPDLLKALVEKHEARDSTVRGTALAELASMTTRTSQYNPGGEIPEKNWLYRLAKRFWFHDFGVYRGYDHSRTAAPGILKKNTNPVN
jgi:MoaA/NifB/PqqE/SkfB family radical SAM enzyme